MTNYLHRSQFRKHGTASMRGRNRRYQPPEWTWTPIDDDNNDNKDNNKDNGNVPRKTTSNQESSALLLSPSCSKAQEEKLQPDHHHQQQQERVVTVPRKRRKRKRMQLPMNLDLDDDDENGFGGKASSFVTTSRNEETNKRRKQHWNKQQTMTTTTRETTFDQESSNSSDTPLLSVGGATTAASTTTTNNNNTKRRVSPEEQGKALTTETTDTPQIGGDSRHGERVLLDVETSSSMMEGNNNNEEEYMTRLVSTHATTSPCVATTTNSTQQQQDESSLPRQNRDNDLHILGTLEQVMHVHARFNNGPIPEPIIAHLVLEVVRFVGTNLHRHGATHNNLGLDSFVLVRRSSTGDGGEDGANDNWCLECTDIADGSHNAMDASNKLSIIHPSAPDDDVQNGDGSAADQKEQWRFKHDLYSVANIVHLLLSGGTPLAWQRNNASELIELPSNNVYANVYMRGRLAWEELFQALLNPPDASCGLHCVKGDRWTDTVKGACSLLELLSKEDEREQLYFDHLMQHVSHGHTAADSGSVRIQENDRFPVKLVGNPLQEASDSPSRLTSLSRQEKTELASVREELYRLTDALKGKEEQLSSLCLAKEHELQELRGRCEEERDGRIAARQLAEDRSKQLEEEKLQRRQIEKLSIMQRRGFETAMNDKDKALAKLRHDLRLNETRKETELAEIKQRLEDTERRYRSNMAVANEDIADLKTENADLFIRLDETENLLKSTEIEKSQLEELHEASLAQTNSSSDQPENRHMESELRLRGDIDCLMAHAAVASSDFETQLLRQREEAKSVLEAQLLSHEYEMSKMEMEWQRRECALIKRIQELEDAAKRRSNDDVRTLQSHEEATAASRTSAPRRGSSLQSSASSHTFFSSRLQQATQLRIPGMSLTAAGFLPRKASSASSRPSDSSRRSNGPTRLVISDPYLTDQSGSDSDSE